MRWFGAVFVLVLAGVAIFQAAGPRPRFEFGDDERDHFTAAAFSPDGAIIVAGGAGNVLKLWDAQTGKAIRQLLSDDEKVTQQIREVGFSVDGKHV